MENFTNSVILPVNLPEIDSRDFNPLNRKYLIILAIRIVVLFLISAGGLAAFLILSDEKPPLWIILSVVAFIFLLIATSALLTFLGFPKKGYLVREKDVSFQRGLITHRVTSVPLNRIQHVEVSQGVLAKILGLSTVNIYTAGGNSSDLSIPGLPVDEAKRVKAFLSGKISDYE
ncbi:MAG TPA: PH domain-containing protein [Prolixibacteraceae bacterium]|nr:PH domain-containing protein [Prolixibacteraceae bacterium]